MEGEYTADYRTLRMEARVSTHIDLVLLSPPSPFILFIKGTFHRISPLSFCPSPAAIHFNPALVKASWLQNRRVVVAGRAELLI